MSKYNRELIPEFRKIKNYVIIANQVLIITLLKPVKKIKVWSYCPECDRPTLETIKGEERCWSCDYIRRIK